MEQLIMSCIYLVLFGSGLWMVFLMFLWVAGCVVLVVKEWGKPEPEGGYVTLDRVDDDEE